MKCICCSDQVKCIEPSNDPQEDRISQEKAVFTEVLRTKYTEKAENRMWLNGVVSNMSAGYGSDWDGEAYVIAICDKCIRIKLNEGVLAMTGNYMFSNNSEVNDEIDHYRKLWRRNNNLDELL